MNKLIIIGAGGHGKVIADIAVKIGYSDIVFLDDDDNLKECAGFPVIGKASIAKQMIGDKIVAIGSARVRERIQAELSDVVSLVHPNAVISRRVTIGSGSVIMAGVVINSDSLIGDGCIINTGASVDHDCCIKSFAHISVGAHVSGTCVIGERVWLGAGAIVINTSRICSDSIIGARAVVINDVLESGTYVGVPAKRVK